MSATFVRLGVVLALMGASACAEPGPELPAKVQFEITSSFCFRAQVRLRLVVDTLALAEQLVSVDTVPWSSRSGIFFATPGTHTVGADVLQWGPTPSTFPPYRIFDTTVTLAPNETFVPTVDLYCS